jgi:hypothetical protein
MQVAEAAARIWHAAMGGEFGEVAAEPWQRLVDAAGVVAGLGNGQAVTVSKAELAAALGMAHSLDPTFDLSGRPPQEVVAWTLVAEFVAWALAGDLEETPFPEGRDEYLRSAAVRAAEFQQRVTA